MITDVKITNTEIKAFENRMKTRAMRMYNKQQRVLKNAYRQVHSLTKKHCAVATGSMQDMIRFSSSESALESSYSVVLNSPNKYHYHLYNERPEWGRGNRTTAHTTIRQHKISRCSLYGKKYKANKSAKYRSLALAIKSIFGKNVQFKTTMPYYYYFRNYFNTTVGKKLLQIARRF